MNMHSKTFKGQATFFDGLLFLLLVIFSLSLVFVSLNSYSEAQDRALRSAYLVNYLQSTTKALYYIDVNTLKDVETYCDDLGSGTVDKYCKPGINEDWYSKNANNDLIFDCNKLGDYPNYITVADLLKKDVTPAPGHAPFMDDLFGTSNKHGRTALRCSMKEMMKPFTFSGYQYLAEVTRPGGGGGLSVESGITPEYVPPKEDYGYASSFLYDGQFSAYNSSVSPSPFDCANVSSSQLLVLRSPFQVIENEGIPGSTSFKPNPWAFRLCLWPTE